MHYLELTLPTLAENLALDEALLLSAETGGPQVLRIWEWSAPAVVLGAACRLGADVIESACTRDNVPIARRASGGGTVLLGPGCLLFSLVLNYESAAELREIRPSYCFILHRICEAFADSFEVRIAGISDLAMGERKVSGNAQQRKRHHLLHHGAILYNYDIGGISRYLSVPERQPEYRAGREHADFLVNLTMPRNQITHRLRVAWDAHVSLTAPPLALTTQLCGEKYQRTDWTRRR